ncbi:DUF3283 family protein [Aeromonas hydrophila]
MPTNLANLSAEVRRRIDLDKQAAFLVWSYRHGRATREDVAKAITQQPAENQEYFRERLNHYREVKGSYEQ